MDLRVGFMVFLVALLGGVGALVVLPLLQYLLAAALLAFVLYPLHEALAHRTVAVRGTTITISPRISAAAVTVFGIVATVLPLLGLSLVVLQTVLSFVDDLDDMALTEIVRDALYDLGLDDTTIAELETYLTTEIDGFLERSAELVLQEMLGLLNTSFQIALGLLVLVFLLYYFLVDGHRLIGWIGSVAPIQDDAREELVSEIEDVTWAVLMSHVLVAFAEGVLGGIGLYLLGVPNAAFWTIIMIVVSFLPAIGIWLVWAPVVGYLFLIGEPVSATLLLAYGITVLSVVDNYLRAILVDMGSGVHPGTVLVGVIGGLYLFGFLGLLLGPVLLATFKAVVEVFSEVYEVRDEPSEDASPP
ncbi:AI-2E family transporter [Natronorubrum sp. JWXQ-INN-674]|uniref:AI-2E family transporter n=1 Tax=Natronorubrum halalkaliphilum TaxID=2691917 RepID=A0A6B0VFF5_9EURY|nr:AI-2E family transporter [Natronorubrum halalkaliphilum]MXV60501.1 AI-2E family transporter [Natronorubrum halalkaliphilum]